MVYEYVSYLSHFLFSFSVDVTSAFYFFYYNKITYQAWKIYFPIHKYLLSNKTGIHKNASYEYHAITTILYWGRLFPVSIARMRFSLSQLSCCHGWYTYPVTRNCYPHDVNNQQLSSQTSSSRQICGLKAPHVHYINYNMIDNDNNIENNIENNNENNNEKSIDTTCTHPIYLATPYKRCNAPYTTNTNNTPIEHDPKHVTGYHIQHHPSQPSKQVIFYLYGGAYLGGNSKGNLNFGEKIGQQCGINGGSGIDSNNNSSSDDTVATAAVDVFLPNYRLLPEYTFFDALYDVCLAYEYLVKVKGYHPKDIILFGISSGGGLLVRLMQRIVEFGQTTIKNHDDVLVVKKLAMVPKGAVLVSPFVGM